MGQIEKRDSSSNLYWSILVAAVKNAGVRRLGGRWVGFCGIGSVPSDRKKSSRLLPCLRFRESPLDGGSEVDAGLNPLGLGRHPCAAG